MNKKMKIVNLVLLAIIFILMIVFYMNFGVISVPKVLFTDLILLILIILTLIEWKHKNPILDNCKYNIMLLFSNIITLIIIIRDHLDNYIILNSADKFVSFGFTSSGSMFIDNNLIFIIIIYIGILAFNILNSIKKDF